MSTQKLLKQISNRSMAIKLNTQTRSVRQTHVDVCHVTLIDLHYHPRPPCLCFVRDCVEHFSRIAGVDVDGRPTTHAQTRGRLPAGAARAWITSGARASDRLTSGAVELPANPSTSMPTEMICRFPRGSCVPQISSVANCIGFRGIVARHLRRVRPS